VRRRLRRLILSDGPVNSRTEGKEFHGMELSERTFFRVDNPSPFISLGWTCSYKDVRLDSPCKYMHEHTYIPVIGICVRPIHLGSER
jgi:hypothetical protein